LSETEEPSPSPAETELPPGITREEYERHIGRCHRFSLAASYPLAGPLFDAFGCPEYQVCGMTLRPVTLGDVAFLSALRHPLIDALAARLAGEEEGKDFEINGEDVAVASSLWSEPHRKAIARWAEGKDYYRSQALAAFVLLPEKDRALLAQGVFAHLTRPFKTFVPLRAPASAGETTTVYQSATASDGFGWWLGLVGAMVRDFNMPLDYVLAELPLIQAIVLSRWGQWSAGLELDGDGYVAQEAERLSKANAKGNP
jgi:hypothetical protein